MAKRPRCDSSAEVAHGRPRDRVLYLVGPRLPRPYHFPARIQSFQAVAAPFPGEGSILTPWPPIAVDPSATWADTQSTEIRRIDQPRRRAAASPFASRIRPLGLSLSRTYSNSSPPAPALTRGDDMQAH